MPGGTGCRRNGLDDETTTVFGLHTRPSDERVDERELILYFHRDSVDDPWYMKLEDSLRELSPDSARQH